MPSTIEMVAVAHIVFARDVAVAPELPLNMQFRISSIPGSIAHSSEGRPSPVPVVGLRTEIDVLSSPYAAMGLAIVDDGPVLGPST